MVYHKRMGRSALWVRESVVWLGKNLNIQDNGYPKIWPIVQAHNDPGHISATEFESVLKAGLAGESTGVMMFTTGAVAEDEHKIQVMKAVYQTLDSLPTSN
jgi:hypothetical protein